MSDPFADSWGDLAAEFGIEPPPKPLKPPVEEPTPAAAPASEPDAVMEQAVQAKPLFDEPAPLDLADSIFGEGVHLPDAQDDTNDTEVIPTAEDGTPDSGETSEDGEKKKRRRRRRRKKGEPGAEVEETPTAAESESFTQPSGGGAGDGASREALRDLIAKWDVPSWDDIVAGLHRPNR